MKTLKEIIKEENEHRHEDGEYGITACKESIKWDMENKKKTLFQLLEEYYNRAINEPLFNDAMVLACWELINNK